MIHKLKIWHEHLSPIIAGLKHHECRRDDRNYRVGDILVLQEYDPAQKIYLGTPDIKVRVTHIDKCPGCARGYVVLSFDWIRS